MCLNVGEIFTKINPLRCCIEVEGYPIGNILSIIFRGVFRDLSLATKKYKYDRRLLRCKLKDVWGENIRKIAMFFVLAMAMIAVPAMAVGTNLANMGSVWSRYSRQGRHIRDNVWSMPVPSEPEHQLRFSHCSR